MALPPIVLEDGKTQIGLESGTGYIALEGGSYIPTGNMPNLVGLPLWDAIGLLQQNGILVPASIGYFGTYPISVIWVPASVNRGIVIAQSIAVGVNVPPNSPVVLTVNDYPIAVAFP
jgi:beta-lactam-binding protein with PASTA domain